MRQKWFDVVAAISLATCEHGACMFIPAPQPVGFTALRRDASMKLVFHFAPSRSTNWTCFVGASACDEANLSKKSACLERQA